MYKINSKKVLKVRNIMLFVFVGLLLSVFCVKGQSDDVKKQNKNNFYTDVTIASNPEIPFSKIQAKDGGKTKNLPNIIYIMLDEIGYYEPSYMGNKKLLTPSIDKLASEGMVFTNAYAGAAVCGPTRVCLMTGKNMAHSSMRGNSGGDPIRADETTVAAMLKKAGYATGGFGKWGCGNRGTSGVPEKHGFDEFFGYYDQVHAHSFYPDYLIKNSKEVPLKGNKGYYEGETHAQDEIFKESVKFIKKNRDNPFFCYLPWTPPHGLWGLSKNHPSYKLFENKPWKVTNSWKEDDAIRYAAMLHMTDVQIGKILDLLKELDIDKNTIVFFSGDNGGADYFASEEFPRGLFGPNVNPKTGSEFKGKKGTVYEGGLKIPMAVRYLGKIRAGLKSDFKFYFPDFMATAADLANIEVPEDCDGLSILPTLFDKGRQKSHDYMYWSHHKQHAFRSKNWKLIAIREKSGEFTNFELYNIAKDPGETTNLASKKKRKLACLKKEMLAVYTDPVGGEIYDKELFLKDHNINGKKPRYLKKK